MARGAHALAVTLGYKDAVQNSAAVQHGWCRQRLQVQTVCGAGVEFGFKANMLSR